MDMPYPHSQYFHEVQDKIFEPRIAELSKKNMEAYRLTPEGWSIHSLIMCDSAWDSRRNASHCFHPVLTLAHGNKPKVISKGVVSRHYSSDPPEKDINGNFLEIIKGHQNYFGSSPGMVSVAVKAGTQQPLLTALL
jgi:hypothetical protein